MSRNFSFTKQALTVKKNPHNFAQVAQQKCATTPAIREHIGLTKPSKQQTLLPEKHIEPVFTLHFRILNTHTKAADSFRQKDPPRSPKALIGPVCTKSIVPA